MRRETKEITHETLDPEDWELMRKLGHKMLDDMLTHLQNIRSAPSGSPPQKAIARALP